MRIISWNVNGIRAVCKNDFSGWLKKSGADIVCIQEIKAQEAQIPAEILNLGYRAIFSCASRPGYSGVAVFTKIEPSAINRSIGMAQFDGEGRIIELEFPQFTFLALYMPHGGRFKERLDYKLACFEFLIKRLGVFKKKDVILAGDFNIAHDERDLARPKENANNIMFTPAERVKLDSIMNSGFVDSFRIFNSDGGHYTWWPYMANARERNLGWRLDYIFASGGLSKRITAAFISEKVRGSDHCPVGVDII